MSDKYLIAMSGGVDSAAAAYLIKKMGHDCLGATMRLFDKYLENDEKNLSDINDAKKICDVLGIDFSILDLRDEFKASVIDDFILAYEKGLTPNPCVVCNKYMKFGLLFEFAKELGCNKIVTGHYARIEKAADRYYLKKATDEKKDQSYFLYTLNQKKLKNIVFPLGNMEKNDIRDMVAKAGFTIARKKDSQDICFVPDGDYISVIKKFTNKSYPEGNFISDSGKILGVHSGIINYTIGQRKGLGLAFGEKMYVKEKNADNNEVILSGNEALFSSYLTASDLNWIAFDSPLQSFRTSAKIRSASKETPCTVNIIGADEIRVDFDFPQRAIAKGQTIVFYDGDIVIGGGTIK